MPQNQRMRATRHVKISSHDVELLDQLGIFDKDVVALGRVCVPILRYSLYSVIKEQYSTRCPRGIEYPSFSNNPLHLSTLKDYIYVEYLHRPSFLGALLSSNSLLNVAFRFCSILFGSARFCSALFGTLRTLSVLSGILRPYPQVRLLRIVSNMKLSKNTLS